MKIPGVSSELGLPHRRALDGVRGVAVIAVLLFDSDRLGGGYLGVDLFFVLSGYLITSLLLVEARATGTVRLIGFWARRARRLLPALLLVLSFVGLREDGAHYRGESARLIARWLLRRFGRAFDRPNPYEQP